MIIDKLIKCNQRVIEQESESNNEMYSVKYSNPPLCQNVLLKYAVAMCYVFGELGKLSWPQ